MGKDFTPLSFIKHNLNLTDIIIVKIQEFLSDLSYSSVYHNKYDNMYSPVITVSIHKNVSSKERGEIWDYILDSVFDFVEANGYDFILDYLTILVERGL